MKPLKTKGGKLTWILVYWCTIFFSKLKRTGTSMSSLNAPWSPLKCNLKKKGRSVPPSRMKSGKGRFFLTSCTYLYIFTKMESFYNLKTQLITKTKLYDGYKCSRLFWREYENAEFWKKYVSMNDHFFLCGEQGGEDG